MKLSGKVTVCSATKLTAAIGDMETAYTNAAGRVLPDESELGAGDISGQTIYPGTHSSCCAMPVASLGQIAQ